MSGVDWREAAATTAAAAVAAAGSWSASERGSTGGGSRAGEGAGEREEVLSLSSLGALRRSPGVSGEGFPGEGTGSPRSAGVTGSTGRADFAAS